ncbi:MAG: glycosyltransferase [bacterium]|nr:glycosyltransferase [bacterium]
MNNATVYNDIFLVNFSALEHEYPLLAVRVKDYLASNGRASVSPVQNPPHTVRFDVPQGHNCIVIFGIDSAEYLLSVAASAPRYAYIVAVEKSLSQFAAVLFEKDLSRLIKGWRIKFIIDSDKDSFSDQFKQYYFQIDSVSFVKAPKSYILNEEYYVEITVLIPSLIVSRTPRKVEEKTYVFLMLIGSSGTGWPFILQDCIAALHQLGHQAYTYNIGDGYDMPQFFRMVDVVKPDVVFLLDAIGLVPEILEKTGIPYVSWFFDNPFLWLKSGHVSERYHIVVWDKTYVSDLHAAGFPHVTYVPLGANPAVFYPRNVNEQPLSFVGSSLFQEAELPFPEEAKKVFIRRVSERLCRSPWTPIEQIIAELTVKMGISFSIDDPVRKHEFEAFVQNYARSGYRKGIIQQLLEFNPVLYGDKGWMNLISEGKGEYKGRINNRLELPELYSASKININITVPQIRNSFSHRAFEIPACRGFLLSDYRPEAESFFELDSEIVCFRTYDELRDKTLYYSNHPEDRKEIARRGYERVIAEHTYAHRMQKIVEFVLR